MRPVVICSSQRFKDGVYEFAAGLERLGVPLVITPDFKRHSKKMIQKPEQRRLKTTSYKVKVPGWVFKHFRNIDMVARMGGVCLIYNPKGYLGFNTTLEVGRADGKNMPIFAFEPHPFELAFNILVHNFVKTPQDLLRWLK
jgi:hypothetical protein